MSNKRHLAATLCLLAALLMPASPVQAQHSTIPPGFVALRTIDPTIRQDMRYAGSNNFTGQALPGYYANACLLRRPAVLALKGVQADLAKQGLSLKVYDCYRPTRAVAAMARWATDVKAPPDTGNFYPGLKKSRLFALGYIASHSAHSRGVAVDLTLVPRDAPPEPPYDASKHYGTCVEPANTRAPDNSLDMGTSFDCFSTRSYTHSPMITSEQRARRQILLRAMTRHGFKNYRREWWHFSYPSADTRMEYDFPIDTR